MPGAVALERSQRRVPGDRLDLEDRRAGLDLEQAGELVAGGGRLDDPAAAAHLEPPLGLERAVQGAGLELGLQHEVGELLDQVALDVHDQLAVDRPQPREGDAAAVRGKVERLGRPRRQRRDLAPQDARGHLPARARGLVVEAVRGLEEPRARARLGDERAAALLLDEEALALELGEGLANRRARDREVLAELVLGRDPLPRQPNRRRGSRR